MAEGMPFVPWIPSPLLFSREMDDDVIGKVAQLSGRVDRSLDAAAVPCSWFSCNLKRFIAAF